MSETQVVDEKARWEIEKLKAEVEHLRRPWLRTPASWVAIVTALIAFTSVAVQSCRSNREYELAEIKRERAELEIQKADDLRKQYRIQIAQAEMSLRDLQKKRVKALNELGLLQVQIEKLRTQVPTTPEAKATFTKALELWRTVKLSNAELVNQTEEAVGNLQALGDALDETAPSSLPAFAVVASFTKRVQAEKFAKDVYSIDKTYSIEVYQREPHRFAVTLGGYLPYSEANKRVAHAKANGLNDAYVRFAKNWGRPVITFPGVVSPNPRTPPDG